MKNFQEQTYWITLAHMPKWGSEKINRLLIKIHQKDSKLDEFFELSESEWKRDYELQLSDLKDLENAKKSLPNNSFLAENLLSQGFDIIPITSQDYPRTLKDNLKTKLSPPVVYTKGNKQIFEEDSIAIVGSRDASEISLKFTDNIAKIASQKFKVVVSGFAKGVDKQALDSALKYDGRSIIVLPQGILTFSSSIRKYYTQIVEGNCLVLSTFHPKSVWSAGLAMARNPIIYGLAKDIYVAQSSDSGGTWEGVKRGLKIGRKIYVRMPDSKENTANQQLINLGAISVDFNGNEISKYEEVPKEKDTVKETVTPAKEISTKEIVELLQKSAYALSIKEISARLNSKIKSQKIAGLLKGVSGISKIKGKPIKYVFQRDEGSLFSKVDEEKIPEMVVVETDSDIIHSAKLELMSLDFDWTSDWKFKHKGTTIRIKVSDYEFINKVNNGFYGFAKSDLIYADIKLLEKSVPERYELIKVVDIKLKYKR